MKTFSTGSKLIYVLLLFIFSISFTYSQTVSGALSPTDANGTYSPNGYINGKLSWKLIAGANTYYIYYSQLGTSNGWLLDNDLNYLNGVLFVNPSGVDVPPASGWQAGLGSGGGSIRFNGFTIDTISGNAGAAGATLNWTDGAASTVTADGSGNYSINVSNGWTGTVTPSLAGYTFSPVSNSYTNVTTNQTNQNYTATPITYTITGNTTVPGATISWTDGTAKTATADGFGNYTITVSYNFSGTVTPSEAGFSFSPASRTYTNVLVNQIGQGYNATVTISGNAGVAGATLSWNDGASKTTTTDGSGNYSLSVSYDWTGRITPSTQGYFFTPTHTDYFNLTTPQTNQNYTATPITYTISGNAAGVAGVTLSWIDGTAKTTTSDSFGHYSITVPYNWSGTVTPSEHGYIFSAPNTTYTNVLSDQTNQNYSVTIIRFISGNTGIAGATLSWTDLIPKTTTADGGGNYSFAVSFNWSGTVTPSLAGYTFTPANKTYTNLRADSTNQNYTPLVTISGNTTIPGATLSWTDGTIQTTTSDGSGNYSFTVPYNWSGTVTPSLTGYIFTPASKTYTNVLVGQASQNYNATAITYTISGNAGIAGATLSWTDGTSKTATADGSGNYSFTVSYNWSGTVTPTLTGYTFGPVNKTYTNVLASQTGQNYISSTATFAITGNAGVDGVTLSWIDGTANTTTSDSTGNYMINVSYNWSGTVTPSKTGFSFTTVNKTYMGITVDMINQNYSASINGAPLAKEVIQLGNNSFTASWGTLPGMQGYRIDVAIDPNFTSILPNYNNLDVGTNLSVSVTGLISGTDYYYRVRAYYHNIVSSNSNTIVASTSLNSPTNLTAVYNTLGIQLKWNYDFSNTNVAGFVIFREGGPNSGNPKLNKTTSLVPIDTVNGTATTYVDKSVLEGYAYNYSVSAYNLSRIISTVGDSITAPAVIPLKSPVSLTGVAQPGSKIVLFWKNKSTTASGTIIQRSTGDSTNFTELARTLAADTLYTDSTVQAGIKYFYRIAAYRDTIVSSFSNTINVTNTLTGITDLLLGVPKEYKLYQNYPNPFNPTTQIRFALPKQSHVNLTVYNILGAVVKRLYEGELNAGYHEFHFNASGLSSGIYIYRMAAGTYSQVLKMVLIK